MHQSEFDMKCVERQNTAMSNWHVAKEWFKEGRIRFFFNFGFRFQVNFNVLKVFTDLIPSVYVI